jgi:hypothetical protein
MVLSLVRGIFLKLPYDRLLSAKLWKTFQNYALPKGLSREGKLSGDKEMSGRIVMPVQLGPTLDTVLIICGIL